MFNKLGMKSMFQTLAGRVSGQTDVLEAILAIGMGAAAADGKVTRAEVDTVLTSAKGNPVVSKLFTADVVEATMSKFVAKMQSLKMGAVWKELEDCAAKPEEIRHAIFTAGVSVANHGGIDAAERTFLDKAAKTLNIFDDDRNTIISSVVSDNVEFDL